MKQPRWNAEDWERFGTETLEEAPVWTAEGIPVLTGNVRLSVPPEQPVWRRIRTYYSLQRRSFLRYCEGELFPYAVRETRTALESSCPVPAFHAELESVETFRKGKFWSLYVEEREGGFPYGGYRRRWGDTWDIETGFPVPLSDLFPVRSPWRGEFVSLAEAEITRQEKRGEARYHPDWRKLIRKEFHARDFYLTEEGIAFFYPMYAVAPAAEGIPVFLFPWEDVTKFREKYGMKRKSAGDTRKNRTL